MSATLLLYPRYAPRRVRGVRLSIRIGIVATVVFAVLAWSAPPLGAVLASGSSPVPPTATGPDELKAAETSMQDGGGPASTLANVTHVTPEARYGAGMAYDAKDGYVVLFGGFAPYSYCNKTSCIYTVTPLNDTWIFEGNHWKRLDLSTHPPARFDAGMTYDAADGYIVLFGGNGSAGCFPCSSFHPMNDTWTFAGGSWTNVSSAVAPPARAEPSLAYDASDGYAVLFGGVVWTPNGTLYKSDTWTFSAGLWTRVNRAVHPSARAGASMAYDVNDSYVLLFGGRNRSGYLNDTWRFHADGWTEFASRVAPSARQFGDLVDDPAGGQVMLFGGFDGTARFWGFLTDTWLFKKGAWKEDFTTTVPPQARDDSGVAFDAGRGYVLLFGGRTWNLGSSPGGFLGDDWYFVRSAWGETPFVAPGARQGAAMVYDARDGYLLLFGGYYGPAAAVTFGDTWTFRDNAWTESFLAVHPSNRTQASMAYDPKDGYVVLFGGIGPNGGYLNDTWTYAGGAWHKLTTPSAPSPRAAPSMTYDASDGYVLLFGGSHRAGFYSLTLNDTWKFAGGTWSRIHTGPRPPSRSDAAMTYDAKDGCVLLFGGQYGLRGGYSGTYNDSWTYARGRWTNVTPASSPSSRSDPAFIYDPRDGYVLMFGGNAQGKGLQELWTYSGGAWTMYTGLLPWSLVGRYLASIAFLPSEKHVILYGGAESVGFQLGDTWSYADGTWTAL